MLTKGMVHMALYGTQGDIDANPDRNVLLFTPGETKLTAQDVFLGGPGTGVTDEMLPPGITRIYGNTAKGTRLALQDYESDLSSQIKSAIAQNAAPRADRNIGMPSLARQQMEINQAQNMVENPIKVAGLTGKYNGLDTLAQKSFDHGVSQDLFSNEYNVGNMMGNYKGRDTLQKRAQDIQRAQNAAELAISQQNANTNEMNVTGVYPGSGGSATVPDEYSDWVNDAAQQYGLDPALLAGMIDIESGWNPNAVNPSSGATGLGQFLATTAADEGLTDPTDPQASIYAMAKYLAKRIDWAGGDVSKGIMGYGEGTPEYLNKVLKAANKYAPAKTKATKPDSITAQDAKIAQNQAIAIVDSMDSQGMNESEILNYFKTNASNFANKGTDITDIYDYIRRRRYSDYDPTLE